MSAAIRRARAVEAAIAATAAEPTDSIGDVTQIADLDINSATAQGVTPLMHAASNGPIEAVRSLLDRGAQINARRDDGFTALALAAFFGRTEVVQLLLERGADVRATSRNGTSAEMWATARGFLTISDLLREARESQQREEPAPPTVVPSKSTDSLSVPQDALRVARITIAPHQLPENIDPPPATASPFHPGDVFLNRVMANGKSLTALALGLTITLGLAIFALHQISRSRDTDVMRPAPPVSKSSALSDSAVAQPPKRESNPEEPMSSEEPMSPAAATFDLHAAAVAEASKQSSTNKNDVESISASKPDGVSSSESSPTVSRRLVSDGSRLGGIPVSGSSPTQRTVPTSLTSGSAESAREQRTVASDSPIRQEGGSETESKPAPLTIEQRGEASTVPASAAADGARDTGSRSAPLGISSPKPRTKVIQWP